ncbi:hypothetical protein [Streptomyces sp. NEAU-S77]|uniref:hypothetical protein n=1 Tax=Streptomyces sp. NEAU-S77 TaxID=3411033 RepID=UPI003B9E33BF
MNIGKKVAVLAVASGALVLGSAAGASAHGFGGGGGGFNPFGTVQTNTCDTLTGAISSIGATAPSGDITVGSNCLNFTNGTAAVQSNDCDTATGAIISTAGLAPSGDITIGSDCTNIATGTP